ncbi:hypothetical protein HON36_05170 [Candidatus Parcubacteria bacterium]|nr:hypothetical protein [Candidatus Parcubacteria bacterium]
MATAVVSAPFIGWQKVCALLAGVILILAFIPYFIAIVKGETKPSKASWIVWASLDIVAFAGMLMKGSLNYMIGAAVICATTTVFFSFKYGAPGWTTLEKFCIAGAAIGFIILAINPLLSIYISLILLFVGAFPTFSHAWKDPSREDKFAWTLFWLSCVFGLLGTTIWDTAHAGQPIVFFIIESTMMYILYIRARSLKSATS